MRLCAWLEQSKKTTHLARQNRQMVSLFCQLSDMLYTTTPLSPAAEKSVRGNSYICPRNSPLVSEVLSWLMTLSNCQLSQYWAINNLCMSILVAYTVGLVLPSFSFHLLVASPGGHPVSQCLVILFLPLCDDAWLLTTRVTANVCVTVVNSCVTVPLCVWLLPTHAWLCPSCLPGVLHNSCTVSSTVIYPPLAGCTPHLLSVS